MKKKIIFFSAITFSLFIFFIFFKSINSKNLYVPKNISNQISQIKTIDLFTSEELNLEKVLSDSKINLINIWSSWCIPCREEHKYLMKLNKNNKINLLGLNYRDKKNNAKNFIIKYGNPYDFILTDPSGIISIDLGAYGVPETFIIKNKKIVKKFIGPLNEKHLRQIIKMAK
tara:strand:+ start:874 stop:1389 length:516 start_codon:yes stop_codon:yes gene_type:complete